MDERDREAEFSRQAGLARPSLVGEFLQFVRETRKWWLLLVGAVLLVLGLLLLAGGSPAAPFIYTLF